MLESYIRTGDGKDYVDVECVSEALGIKEDENIFRAIEKLKEERDGLKADLELTKRLYKENRNFVDKVCEAVDIQRPYLESGYANAVRLIAEIKRERERDQLKEKCDKLKLRANAAYGTSCGYSASKQPAFLCDVISYSWEFSPIVAQSLMGEPFCRLNNDSIRVELKLTPNANYNGAFDMEDLKRYIQDYGREKKLGIIESVDYQNAKAARAELAHLYKTVLGKERLDPELSPHEIMKAILDAVKRERFSARLETLRAIDDRIDELCDKYVVVQPDRKSTTKERLDYIFAVLAENRERYNQVEKLARLRSDICIALCLGCETDNEDILKRVRMTKECHDALCKDYTELRKAIWEAMDRNPETLPEETARLVGEIAELARGEKLLIEFRDDVAKAIGMDYPTTNQVILHSVKYIYKDRGDAYGMVAKLNDQVTALEKAKEDLQQMLIASRYGSLEDPQRDLSELRKNAIEELKSRGFLFRPEEDETLTEIYAKLLKRYDWTYGSYKEQYRLRQMWHLRWESENERANGEHKRAEKLLKDTTSLKNHIELLKISSSAKANELVALQAFKNECRKLRDEKTKVISALGQDIWDDCLK